MRKVVILIFLGVALNLAAQIQQGFVKTQGRPNRPGIPLSGVMIRWRGVANGVVSSSSGKFNVVFPGKKNGDAICLVSVRKKNYELIDPDIIGRQLVFNTEVPHVIVMASSTELEANRKRISNNAYRKAENRYQEQVKELESQLKADNVTIEQYEHQLKILQDNYEKYISLIEGMADRYARTDYDNLDSIDREINICIENGELEKADSLILSVFDPNTVLERNRMEKAEIDARMKLAQEIIDNTNAEMEEIRKDSIYAKRIMNMCDQLSEEYITGGNVKRAKQYLEHSLNIRIVLYGEESEQVKIVKQKIDELK